MQAIPTPGPAHVCKSKIWKIYHPYFYKTATIWFLHFFPTQNTTTQVKDDLPFLWENIHSFSCQINRIVWRNNKHICFQFKSVPVIVCISVSMHRFMRELKLQADFTVTFYAGATIWLERISISLTLCHHLSDVSPRLCQISSWLLPHSTVQLLFIVYRRTSQAGFVLSLLLLVLEFSSSELCSPTVTLPSSGYTRFSRGWLPS